jgi:hypothetical protein
MLEINHSCAKLPITTTQSQKRNDNAFLKADLVEVLGVLGRLTVRKVRMAFFT